MRAEFTRKTRAKAFARADGCCEKCHAKLQTGRIEYHHEIEAALGGSNEVGNCLVLCRPCHGGITAGTSQPRIAKVKRIRDRHSGALTIRSSWACGRNSKFKKKINGQVVLR